MLFSYSAYITHEIYNHHFGGLFGTFYRLRPDQIEFKQILGVFITMENTLCEAKCYRNDRFLAARINVRSKAM